MKYPTIDEVNKADRMQLAKWVRFLPSPGTSAIGHSYDHFTDTLRMERDVLLLVQKRFDEIGGMTPRISKQIGWDGG